MFNKTLILDAIWSSNFCTRSIITPFQTGSKSSLLPGDLSPPLRNPPYPPFHNASESVIATTELTKHRRSTKRRHCNDGIYSHFLFRYP